ncbi:hypothetical protein MTR_1g007017 [Medicago truncatula]|uniref:Uncharacterized protein n=1 Tax=Medicago truncatula TaxID=3880 RepID=A0A072VDN7_MEDTR|nr:hypothetical protein MTR_1g007017 [Medicago truncatula]
MVEEVGWKLVELHGVVGSKGKGTEVVDGDYDYDIPLSTIEEGREFICNETVQISFPQLKELVFLGVPKLKCFCSGGYN